MTHVPLLVSVIIPNLDSPLLHEVIDRVAEQTITPHEIIVVGLDRIGRLAQARYEVQVIDSGVPISPAAARNRGAEVATGDLLCFVDADCLPAPDWLEQTCAAHLAGAQVVCGGVTFPGGSYWRLCDNLAFLADFAALGPPGQREHVPSLNLSLRRSVFKALGGFNELFAPSGEDTDLSLRLRAAGHRLVFAPRASVAHCPPRHRPGDAWRHLRTFGHGYRRIQATHAPQLGRSLRVTLALRLPLVMRVVAPLLALLDVLGFYRRQPALWRYWYALPGTVFARTAWYIGLAAGRLNRVPGGTLGEDARDAKARE